MPDVYPCARRSNTTTAIASRQQIRAVVAILSGTQLIRDRCEVAWDYEISPLGASQSIFPCRANSSPGSAGLSDVPALDALRTADYDAPWGRDEPAPVTPHCFGRC